MRKIMETFYRIMYHININIEKGVKVGKSITLTYKVRSTKGICNVRIHMTYDTKALQIASEENDRLKTWLCNNSFPDYIDGTKTYDLYELVSVDPNKTEYKCESISDENMKKVGFTLTVTAK